MTLDEIFPDGRGDGRKFMWSSLEAEWFEPVFRDSDHAWAGLLDNGRYTVFLELSNIQTKEWHPPKNPKKVKVYRAILIRDGEEYFLDNSWSSVKKVTAFCRSLDAKIVGWQEMEVEVDE